MLAPRRRWIAGVALAALAGCLYPKYASYASPRGDFRCLVPWGWQVTTEFEEPRFGNVTFLGPFEPDFYLGVPSLSVRWHQSFKAHRLPDGSLEIYSGVDDYIRQMLKGVYGPDPIMRQEVSEIEVASRKGKYFVVVSAAPAGKDRVWGVRVDPQTRKSANLRQHAYVLVPLEKGFYVLVYPATRDGYPKYEKAFNQLVNSFVPLANGPGGEPTAAPKRPSKS